MMIEFTPGPCSSRFTDGAKRLMSDSEVRFRSASLDGLMAVTAIGMFWTSSAPDDWR